MSFADEPLFDEGRFRARHVMAMLVHLPLTTLLFWMMQEARAAGAFNIVWLYFSLFVLVPTLMIAGSCFSAWLDGANQHRWFRALLFVDCAASLFPMLYLGWIAAAWMLGAWPGFFNRPFQLYSVTTFLETLGGGLAVLVVCGLYAWSALRLMFLILWRGGPISGGDVLGKIAPPDSSRSMRPRNPNGDTSRQIVSPPMRRSAKVVSPLPRRLPVPTSFDERQRRVTAARDITWPGTEADAARARAAGFAVFDWNLREDADERRGDARTLFSILHGLAHLAAELSPEEARLAVRHVSWLLEDGRQPFTDERAADGDGMELERIRELNRTAPTVGQVAKEVLEHLRACHPASSEPETPTSDDSQT